MKVDILIGLDFYWSLMQNEVIRMEEGPVLQRSVFGLVLSGCFSDAPIGSRTQMASGCQLLCTHDVSEDTVRSFWNLESIGIIPEEDVCHDAILQQFEQNLSYKEGRYEVGLLWKPDHPKLMDN